MGPEEVRLEGNPPLNIPLEAVRGVELSGLRASDEREWLTLRYQDGDSEATVYLGCYQDFNRIFAALQSVAEYQAGSHRCNPTVLVRVYAGNSVRGIVEAVLGP